MTSNQVVIIDVGVSNLYNVKRGFEKTGADVLITTNKEKILGAPRLVLPGVGAFGAGMKNLEQQNLPETIRKYAQSGKPLIGICLGMQLLMTQSEELGLWKGLDILPGQVVKFDAPQQKGDFKIPQICWNSIEKPGQTSHQTDAWDQSVLNGVANKSYFYFVHSYIVIPQNKADILASTTYGLNNFCSVIRKDNVTGCQFHPERSGQVGLKILNNFLKNS